MMACVEPSPLTAAPRVEQGRASWACEFPQAAVDAGVEHATVVLSVLVRRNGSAADAKILASSSPLFIAPTQQCALSRYYEPARDPEGRRVEGWTAPFKIRYDVH
jgi:outer membrane biosynthesis protein TonB